MFAHRFVISTYVFIKKMTYQWTTGVEQRFSYTEIERRRNQGLSST